MNQRKVFMGILISSVFAFLVFFAVLDYRSQSVEGEYISYNEFITLVEEGEIYSVKLSEGAKFTFKKAEGDEVMYETDNPRNPSLKENLLLNGILVEEDSKQESLFSSILSMVFFAAAIFIALKMLNRQNSGAVMAFDVKEAAEKKESKFNFEDIAGNDEAKESVQDIVDFIKSPEKYAAYGARMPKGVMFYGPPGTGKTLMAKAIAGEAEVPFFAVSGSDFVQMYVGVGASRVRALFKKAREAKRAVIFIDEIDALGKKRSGNHSGGSDERDQTLNALLTEMSGFNSSEGIVVIAATNRLDILDDALLRPGRFDRQVEIGLPDFSGRERILRLHSRNKPISDGVNISEMARQTVYFSGAMLENLMNEAAISAAKRGMGMIFEEDMEEAYYTIVAGRAKKDRSGVFEREKRITAFHEAGHALAAKLRLPENTVAKITIIPSTKGAGGFCLNIPPDKMYFTKSELESQVIVSLAGRASEELIFGEENVTTGASNDLEKASAIIGDYISKFGMSKTAGLAPLSEKEFFLEQREHIDRLYGITKTILRENIEILKRIANALILKETLNETDLDRLITPEFN